MPENVASSGCRHARPDDRKTGWRRLTSLLRADWYRAVLCLALGFILPEYVAVALLFISLIFLIRCIKKEQLKLKIGKLGILLLAYIATAFVSCLYALHKMHSMWMSLLWLATFIAYLVCTTVLTNRSRFRITLQTLAVVAAVCGVISIAQYTVNMLGYDWLSLNLWFPWDSKLYALFTDQLVLTWTDIRTASTFSNPNLYAMEMVVLLPLVAHCLLTAGKKRMRLLYAVLLAIGLLGALFSFSRGGYLAMALAVLVYLVLNLSRTRFARWAMVLVLIAAIAFVFIPNPFMDRLTTIDIDERAISLRLEGWKIAWDAIWQRPIGGYGMGSFNALELIHQASDFTMPHFHNIVIELMIEGGAIAVIIYVLMAWQVFIPNLKLHHTEDWNDGTLGVTFLAIACGFLLIGMVDYPMSTPKGILTFIMLLGLSDCANDFCGIQPTYSLKRRK